LFSGSESYSSSFLLPTSKLATESERKGYIMLLDYILGGAVTVFMLAYLTYALIRPERF